MLEHKEEMMKQLDEYINSKSKDEIIQDLIETGAYKYLEPVKYKSVYYVAYYSKERHCDTYVQTPSIGYPTKEEAIEILLKQNYKHNGDDEYIYDMGDPYFTVWSTINEMKIKED